MLFPTITIDVNVSNIPADLRQDIGKALARALRTIIAKMINFLKRIVPESKYRVPPYPPSYKSEQLYNSAVNVLRLSSSTNSFLSVNYGYPANYASFVNDMSGVKWSKPGSKSQFYQLGLTYLRSIINREISREIRDTLNKKKKQKKYKDDLDDILRLLLAFAFNKQLEQSLNV